VKKMMPEVSKHFEALGLTTTLVSCPWFMCLFIGYLPLEASCRVLDMFLYEGRLVLFRVALAIFKMNKDGILSQRDSVQLLDEMKETVFTNSKELLKIAFEDFENLPLDITELQSKHKFHAIKDIEQKNKKSQLRDLEEKTTFTTEELEQIYKEYHDLIPLSASSQNIDFDQYHRLFNELVPVTWRSNEIIEELAWKRFNNDNIDFDTFASFLSVICKGSLEEKFDFCLKMYDVDRDNLLTQKEVTRGLEAMMKLYSPEKNPDLALFVTMVFDKKGKAVFEQGNTIVEPKLSCEEIKKELFEQPLLAEFIRQSNPQQQPLKEFRVKKDPWALFQLSNSVTRADRAHTVI